MDTNCPVLREAWELTVSSRVRRRLRDWRKGPGVSELGVVKPEPEEKLGPGMSNGSRATDWVMVVVPVPLCPGATEEMRVGWTIHCRSWLVVMAVTVGTKEPGMSTPGALPADPPPTPTPPAPDTHSYGTWTHTHTGSKQGACKGHTGITECPDSYWCCSLFLWFILKPTTVLHYSSITNKQTNKQYVSCFLYNYTAPIRSSYGLNKREPGHKVGLNAKY